MKNNFIKYFLIGTLVCFIMILSGCESQSQTNESTDEQLQCEHEWVEIDWNHTLSNGVVYDIYCPKCQLETTASYKEWNRIQANMEYEK